MNSTKKGNDNSKHKSSTSRNEIKQSNYNGKNNFKNNSKREYTWQLVKSKGKELASLTKYGKTYLWCSTETGAPKSKGFDKWICHKPINCRGLVKKRAAKQGTTTDTPSKNAELTPYK